jgi:hypothetical protein
LLKLYERESSLFGLCNYIRSCRFEVYGRIYVLEIMVKSSLKFFKFSIKLSIYVMSIDTEATENAIKVSVKQLAYLCSLFGNVLKLKTEQSIEFRVYKFRLCRSVHLHTFK